mmetsp:Transcript_1607/g.2374  ORF Transcript_1607/g.2374 Transcript_1607/m.2374 type:complete len:326 (+) Transcript_1607:136-1113(+)
MAPLQKNIRHRQGIIIVLFYALPFCFHLNWQPGMQNRVSMVTAFVSSPATTSAIALLQRKEKSIADCCRGFKMLQNIDVLWESSLSAHHLRSSGGCRASSFLYMASPNNYDDNRIEDNNEGTTSKSEQKQASESFVLDIKQKYQRDLSQDGFGPLLPIAEKIDEATGGWGLGYADLAPETPKTPLGIAFLATNGCYAFAGLALGVQGEFLLGTLTEIAGAVSFWYHYSQLEFGKDRSEVRLALLTDYITAGAALITGGVYMANMGIQSVPFEAVVAGSLAVLFLSLSWVWEFGAPYLFWHSLWHVMSAYTGYIVGQAHISGSLTM